MYSRFVSAFPPYTRSAILMMVSTLLVVLMHACIRQVTDGSDQTVHPFEVAFFRNAFGMILLLPIIFRHRSNVFRSKKPLLHVARGGLNSASMLLFYVGVSLLPLASIAALSFTSPLFAAAGAFFILREKITIARVAALLIGFGGTLVVAQPSEVGFSTGVLCILGSCLLWALVLLDIKILSRSDSSLTILVYQLVYLTPITGFAALFFWTWPSLTDLCWLVAVGFFATTSQAALTEAYRFSDSSALMPLDFLKLVWASVIGYLLFSQVPDLWTLLGGAMIFAGATWVAIEQTRRDRSEAAAKTGA